MGDALDALALLEGARLEVPDLGLELLDARPSLALERAVCGWAVVGAALDEEEGLGCWWGEGGGLFILRSVRPK